MPVIVVQREPSLLTVRPSLPTDPPLRGLAADVLAKARYALAIAAAGETVAKPGRLDRLFQAFLSTRTRSTRAGYQTRGAALLDAPNALRSVNFGRYAAVDPKEYSRSGSDHVGDHIATNLDPAAIKNSLGKVRDGLLGLGPALQQAATHIGDQKKPTPSLRLDPDWLEGLKFKKMRLFIERVACLEETDEVGSDEINMGGTAIDPAGHSWVIDEFEVSDDFDQGEKVDLGTGRVFAAWNLVTAEPFPHVYHAIMVMAEKDDGGFTDFLNGLWEAINTEVALVAASAGITVGDPVGGVLAGLVSDAVGSLVGWILGAFDNSDDIVDVVPSKMTLGSCTRSYYDWAKLTSPEGWSFLADFIGDGGHYRVRGTYRVATQ
jgi:hypothetical protein